MIIYFNLVGFHIRNDPAIRYKYPEFMSHKTAMINVCHLNGDQGISTGFLYQFESTNNTLIAALIAIGSFGIVPFALLLPAGIVAIRYKPQRKAST
jgi:hypothetical protein